MDNKCGRCGLEINSSETGIEHRGTSISHSPARCVFFLKKNIKELEEEVERLNEVKIIQQKMEQSLRISLDNAYDKLIEAEDILKYAKESVNDIILNDIIEDYFKDKD